MSAPRDEAGELRRLLETEHAAVYGYGPVGGRVAGAALDLARQCEDVHRARRDTLTGLLKRAGASPPAAASSYELPFEVSDPAAALRLGVALEEGVARAYRAALEVRLTPAVRDLCLAALQDAAVRATRWRLLAGITPATIPFP